MLTCTVLRLFMGFTSNILRAESIALGPNRNPSVTKTTPSRCQLWKLNICPQRNNRWLQNNVKYIRTDGSTGYRRICQLALTVTAKHHNTVALHVDEIREQRRRPLSRRPLSRCPLSRPASSLPWVVKIFSALLHHHHHASPQENQADPRQESQRNLSQEIQRNLRRVHA